MTRSAQCFDDSLKHQFEKSAGQTAPLDSLVGNDIWRRLPYSVHKAKDGGFWVLDADRDGLCECEYESDARFIEEAIRFYISNA